MTEDATTGSPPDEAVTAETAALALRGADSRLPDGMAVLERRTSGLGLTSGQLTAAVPATADQRLRLEVGGRNHGFGIVGAPAASKAVAYNDNTVLYAGTAPGASTSVTLAAQDTTTVLETTTIIHAGFAGEVYRFALDLESDERLVMTGDNTAAIVASGGLTVAGIDAPWAVDATGRNVPLGLSVEGNEIVMTVRHHDDAFVYPIVADPAITWTCGLFGCDVYFSRSVTRNMVTPAGVGWALSNFCGRAGPAAGGCYALGAVVGIVAVKASECAGKNQCLKFHIPGGVLTLACRGNSVCSN